MRFVSRAGSKQKETMLGLVAWGCFSATTLRSITREGGTGPLRFICRGRPFPVIAPVGRLPPNDLGFQQAIDATPIDATEHQLGLQSIALSEAVLPVERRLDLFLEAAEAPDGPIALMESGGFSGRLVDVLIRIGARRCALDHIARVLVTPEELLKLSNYEFARLLDAIAVLGLHSELADAFRNNCEAITNRYFDSVSKVFEGAALVLGPEALGQLVLRSVRSIMRGLVIKPIHPLATMARKFCTTEVLIEVVREIDDSRYAAQLSDPRTIQTVGDGLVGNQYPPFTLSNCGLTDRDFTAGASQERCALHCILSGDRGDFIRSTNRFLETRGEPAILSKLIRSLTSELARFKLVDGEIRYPTDQPSRDVLGLAIILNDFGYVAPLLDSGVLAETDPLVAAWKSRRSDYESLNILLSQWLIAIGAAPVRLHGKGRTEVFESCFGGHRLPVAQDRGKISVILASHDPDMILMRMATDSILAQTYRNLELIIVDDGSAAAGAADLKRLAAADNRIVFLRNPQNNGPYHCRNLALEVATGVFVAFHDSDDVAHPQRLEVQIEALLANETCQLCSAAHMRFDSEGGLQFEISHDVLELRGDGPVTAVCRREVFDTVGRFAAVRSRGDIEMRARIQSAYGGHVVRHLDAPLMFCAGGSGNLSLSTMIHHEEYVVLFRRAFRRRAMPPVIEHKFVSPPVGRLSIPFVLGSSNPGHVAHSQV
jgi:hypothetical protein